MLSMGRIIHVCIELILIRMHFPFVVFICLYTLWLWLRASRFAVRIIYFAMLPTGVLNDVNVVVYVILGEVPVYMFLSIYTLLLFFWYADQGYALE